MHGFFLTSLHYTLTQMVIVVFNFKVLQLDPIINMDHLLHRPMSTSTRWGFITYKPVVAEETKGCKEPPVPLFDM